MNGTWLDNHVIVIELFINDIRLKLSDIILKFK